MLHVYVNVPSRLLPYESIDQHAPLPIHTLPTCSTHGFVVKAVVAMTTMPIATVTCCCLAELLTDLHHSLGHATITCDHDSQSYDSFAV